jgi:hypothetical protein
MKEEQTYVWTGDRMEGVAVRSAGGSRAGSSSYERASSGHGEQPGWEGRQAGRTLAGRLVSQMTFPERLK